jgi:predicted deacylase
MAAWLELNECQRHFHETAASARAAWRRLSSSVHTHPGWAVDAVEHSFAHPLKGPLGEQLATDCLWIGPADASRVIVLISGTHGIEAYAGSAVQHMVLENLLNQPHHHPHTAILFVHALTPWGFAWYRRCDENGIDLNRHFVDFSQPLPPNPNYELVRPWLFEPDPHLRADKLNEAAILLGRREYEMALSGGQYVDPLGPFYGGRSANHGRLVTEDLLRRFSLPSRDLVVLDLHTGLGPWGYGELICDHLPDSAGAVTARRLYGAAIAEPALGTSTSVPKAGLADYAWHEQMNSRSCYLTLEFGSYSTDALFDCLITDHQFWARYCPESLEDEQWLPHRERLMEHFCPADPWWRQSVLLRAAQVVSQALHGLEPYG